MNANKAIGTILVTFEVAIAHFGVIPLLASSSPASSRSASHQHETRGKS